MPISLKVNWNDYYCLNTIKDCTVVHNIRLNNPKGGYNEYGCIIDKFDSPRGEIYTIGFPYPSYLLGDESRNIWEEILYRFPYSWNITKIPADQFGEDCEWQIDGNLNDIIEEINKISDQFVSLLKEKIENNEIKGTKSDLLQTSDFAEYNYEKAKKNIKLESTKNNSKFKELVETILKEYDRDDPHDNPWAFAKQFKQDQYEKNKLYSKLINPVKSNDLVYIKAIFINQNTFNSNIFYISNTQPKPYVREKENATKFSVADGENFIKKYPKQLVQDKKGNTFERHFELEKI
jgi:hypothetical protein